VNWYDEDLYDVVKQSIEEQKERIEEQNIIIREQQDLIEQQLKNVVFYKKERKNDLV
jgi:hypothetical protein